MSLESKNSLSHSLTAQGNSFGGHDMQPKYKNSKLARYTQNHILKPIRRHLLLLEIPNS